VNTTGKGLLITKQSGFYEKPRYDIAKFADLLLEHAKSGGTYQSFAAWLINAKGYPPKEVPHTETLRYWMRNHPEFAQVASLAYDIAIGWEILLLDTAKAGKVPDYKYQPHQFKLMNMFGWKKKIDHSGQVDLNVSRATYLEKMISDPKSMSLALELAERLALTDESEEPAIDADYEERKEEQE
jgi:hypothetical protein